MSSPTTATWASCRTWRTSIEAQFGITLGVVSGGNSVEPRVVALDRRHVGRIDNLRLGESILLGRDPLHGEPIAGLHPDAATIVAEVIESKYKPRRAWGDRAQTHVRAAGRTDRGRRRARLALAARRSATRTPIPLDLSAPPGLRIIGASSDHLVIASEHRLRLGAEVAFRPGYSALVRAVSSRNLRQVVRPL